MKKNKKIDNSEIGSKEFPLQNNDSSVKSTVRPSADKINFLNENMKDDGNYGSREDLREKWGLNDSDTNVDHKKRLKFIRVIVAFLVTIMILVSVFYILPRVLPKFFEGSNIELFIEKEINQVYDDSYGVITDCAANVMSEPDITSERITQLLYNEPVVVLNDTPDNGYIKIRSTDGIEGYVKSEQITRNLISIEPDMHEYKLVVSETTKNIMTHASNGTLITKVMMNTVLFADVKRDGVYQITLPDGGTGWIGSSGVIEIGVRDSIEEVSCRYFVSSALSQVNATYLENGVTMNGMSVNGLTYVCAAVNGITLPRTMEEQATVGAEVPMEYDVVTGKLIIDTIIPGDLVFLKSPYNDSNEIYEMAICTDTGTFLMISSARTTIRLRTFTADDDIAERIITVRRVFN